jgi:LmbE family N-acetylglucosaminyl deacetylase
MNVLQRWFVRLVSRRAGPHLRAHGLLRTVKHHPALVCEPGAERVLVLAPHMDDEVIGCGGTLARHARRGGEVRVVFVTDGRSGSKALTELGGVERERCQRELVLERKAEARRALETLGAGEPVFLDAPDWQAASAPHLKDDLRRILDAARPEIVYLPFFLDAHPDHRATAELLLEAARPDDRFECRGYEVWTPLYPNCLVDIGETVEIKRRALEHYRSQLADNDYVHAALGLNAYRSMLLSRSTPGFAEAFFAAPLAEYRRLHDAWRQPS